MTKLAAEQLCRLYHANYGVDAVALRYFSVYGPRQRPDMAFRRFCEAAARGEPIEIFGDGRQTRDFTFVGDVVAAALRRRGARRRRRRRGVQHRRRLAGQPRPRRSSCSRPSPAGRSTCAARSRESGDVQDTGADIARARAELGFEPATELAEGLRAEFEWVLEHSRARSGAVASAG